MWTIMKIGRQMENYDRNEQSGWSYNNNLSARGQQLILTIMAEIKPLCL